MLLDLCKCVMLTIPSHCQVLGMSSSAEYYNCLLQYKHVSWVIDQADLEMAEDSGALSARREREAGHRAGTEHERTLRRMKCATTAIDAAVVCYWVSIGSLIL